MSEHRPEAMRSIPGPPAGSKDPVNRSRSERMGSTVRSRGAVLQAQQSFVPEPLHPLRYGRPGDADCCRSCSLCPPFDENPLDHDPSAERGERRLTMTHESLLSVRSCQPQTVKEALLMSTT